MKQLYTKEDIEALKRKHKGQKIAALALSGAVLLAFIVICILTGTANAAFNENLASALVILCGIILIYFGLNVIIYTSAEITHAEMLLKDGRETVEGTFEMDSSDFRISGSISIRHISFLTDEGKKRLNVIAEKAHLLSGLTGRVRFETVNNYVAAFEECETSTDDMSLADGDRTPEKKAVSRKERSGNGGITKFFRLFFKDLLIYASYGVLAWFVVSFIFGRIEYTPSAKKVMLCIDAEVEQTALSVELEKNKPESMRQVRAYSLGYFMMDDGMIDLGDMYILPDYYATETEDQFVEIPDGLLEGEFEYLTVNGRKIGVLVKRGDVKTAGTFIQYKDFDYYLCFKSNSLHIRSITGNGDDAAFPVFYEFLKLK